MTLTNYWWLLIWLFTIGVFFAFCASKKQEVVLGKTEYRWRMIPALVVACPYAIWAGFRGDGFGDTSAYRFMFKEAPSSISALLTTLVGNGKDKGFTVLMSFFKIFFENSDVTFFLLIAVFQILCIVFVYRKYSTDYWMSFFLFIVSTDYMSWMFNGIRQFIAATGFLACFGLLVKKKYALLICIILLLSTIHASVLIMLPIIFIIQGKAWNGRTILFILAIGIIIVFIDRFTPFLDSFLSETQYSDIVTNDLWTSDDGTSIFRILVYSVPAILSLIGKKYIDEANDPVINICTNASACTMVLYALAGVSSGIYIGRLPIYTTLIGYIAFPWMIDNIFTKQSAKLVKVTMIIAYILFFYYQMHITWHML